MRLISPWEDNPLAALTRVRSRRQLQRLPLQKLWPGLAGALAVALALRFPDYYPAFLFGLFFALFVWLPGHFFGRDMAQLKSLRQGRCLEEMLSVGLTPQGVADTLAWGAWSGLAKFGFWCWSLACLPLGWLDHPVLLQVCLAALPLGLLFTGLSVYLRQVLLLLADSPGQLWRGGLRVYALTCLCLTPPLYVFYYHDVSLGLQGVLLGTLVLLGWLRRQAIAEWRRDLQPCHSANVASGWAWGGWLARFCGNPIFVREVRASRGHSLWMWALLPLLVLAAVGTALPPMVQGLGFGSGFFMLWLSWRLLNFSVLSERARGLLQRERQGGTWELLVQVGVAGPQFVRGWMLATLYRHFGWIVADLLGLGLLALCRPHWVIPGAPVQWVALWALGLWLLGLVMDVSAFLVGLSSSHKSDSVLPGLALTTVAAQGVLLVLVGLGWFNPQGGAFDFAWRQGVPALALLIWMVRLASASAARLPGVLDPLNPASTPLSGCESLPQRVAQAVWIFWVLTSPSLATWRATASPSSMLLVLALGQLAWIWLYQPLAWALAPLRGGLSLRRTAGALPAGLLVGALSAIPVVCAVEASHLYWMFNGQKWAQIQATSLSSDLPGAMICGILAAGLVQLYRFFRGFQAPPDGPRPWKRLVLVSMGATALAAGLWISLRLVFPVQFTTQEQAWWADTRSRLERRRGEANSLLHPDRWDEAACVRLRTQLPLGSHRYNSLECEFTTQLAQENWSTALEQALTLDWLTVYRQLDGDRVSHPDVWEMFTRALDNHPPDRDTLLLLVDRLEQSLTYAEDQCLVDEDFVDRLGTPAGEAWAWWPQALQLARTRQHLRQSGQLLDTSPASPVWTKNHPFYQPSAVDLMSRSRAWRDLLIHRAQMALGQAEWPAFYVTSGGQVFQVTHQDGETHYWISDKSAAQASLQSVLSGDDSQPPRQVLYRVVR